MSGLCTSGEAVATVKDPTIPEPDSSGKRPWWVDTEDQATIQKARSDVEGRRQAAGIKDEPDFSDNLMQEARKRQAAQLLTKSSRRDALANNPGGAAPVSYSLLK